MFCYILVDEVSRGRMSESIISERSHSILAMKNEPSDDLYLQNLVVNGNN